MENDISRELIEKARDGDMAAFEEIYTRTSGFVYNVAFQITRNRTEAEDVTQEVFIKMHRNLSQFRFASSCKTWLYRIAANTALSGGRKAARAAAGMEKLKNEALLDQPGKPFPAEIEQADNERRVAELLEKLDLEQRACVVLRDLEGLSYKEVAEALAIPLNTVRSRLSRARETLLEFAKKEKEQ